jgi:hypothetical protein
LDIIGTAIIFGLCLTFGLAALGLAVAGIFLNVSRTWLQKFLDYCKASTSAITVVFILRILRLLLLAASALCLIVFLFFLTTIRQVYFLDEPLVEAAGKGDLAKVKSLLGQGASPDGFGFDGNTTALVYAATYGHHDVVLLLLCSGANPTLRDSWGQLPVEAAAESGHDDVVQLLKDRSMAFCRN